MKQSTTAQELTEEQILRKNLKEAGVTYSLSALVPFALMFFISAIVISVSGENYAEGTAYRYISYIVPQLCFAGAAALYFYRSKQPMKQMYSGCKWQYFLIAVVLQAGLFSLTGLNEYFIKLLELMGYRQTSVGLMDVTGWNLLPALIVVAVLPALFEETIFRGIISRNMHSSGWGLAATVLISGALFSLFHGNPPQTVYQFCCGACFTLVAIRAGSVFPTIVAHFINNAVILIMTSMGYDDFPAPVKLPFYIVCGVLLAATLVYLIFFDKHNGQKGGVKNAKTFFVPALVGIGVCAAEWLSVLIGGFVGG